MTRHKPAENVVILRSSQRISTWQTEQCMKISWSSHWSMVMKINTYCSYSSGKFGNESALSVIGFFSGSNKYPVELQTDSSNDGPTVEDLANLAARLTDVPRGSQRLIYKGEWRWREALSLYGGLFLLMIHPNKYFCSRTIGLNTLRDRIFPTLRPEDIRGYHSIFKSHVHYMLMFVPNRGHCFE